jgi:hypothetical protein
MEIPVSMDTDMAMGTTTDMDTVMGTVNGKNFSASVKFRCRFSS